MKKECVYTQGMLPRYLKRHLFLFQQKRVERHLAACAVCRSRHDALRQSDETREFLQYLDAETGFAGRVRPVAAGLTRLFFRPLWVLAIIGAALAVRNYVVIPLLHDPDLEKLDAGGQQQAAAPPAAGPQTAAAPTVPAPPAPVSAQPAPPAAVEPLVVVITVEKEQEKASIARINEAMKEHALLKSMRFSDKVREISGSLTPDELTTFFVRIQGSGKITYKRSRLAAAGGEVLPFVMKLQTLSAPPARAAADKQAETKKADVPAAKAPEQAGAGSAEPPARPAPPASAPQAQ